MKMKILMMAGLLSGMAIHSFGQTEQVEAARKGLSHTKQMSLPPPPPPVRAKPTKAELPPGLHTTSKKKIPHPPPPAPRVAIERAPVAPLKPGTPPPPAPHVKTRAQTPL